MSTEEKEKLIWHTEKRKVNDLIPYEHNPRQMTQKQIDDLTKSLQKFNLVELPAVDIDNKIIAGHQRLKIMQLIGRGDEEIEVRMPNRKLTEDEFREYNIRSNKNTGGWDFDILANEFDMQQLIDFGFDEHELSCFKLPEEEQAEPEMTDGVQVVLKMKVETWPEVKEKLENLCQEYEIEIDVS